MGDMSSKTSDGRTEPAGLAARWAEVQQRVAAACRAAGRDPAEVTILPVSKTFGADVIRAAVALGMRRLGENKVQEIRAKAAPLADCGIAWVMIGHLQTNKARDVARLARKCSRSTGSNSRRRSTAGFKSRAAASTCWCRSRPRPRRASTACRRPSCRPSSTASRRSRRCTCAG